MNISRDCGNGDGIKNLKCEEDDPYQIWYMVIKSQQGGVLGI